jgi:hypothetical protein
MKQLVDPTADHARVYRGIERNVNRKSTGQTVATSYSIGFIGKTRGGANYDRQYLAKNPNGYGGIGRCGVEHSPKELLESRKG